MSQAACIIYGLNEGPAMGQKLIRAFEQSGFTITTDPKVADCIFAHSGGCFLIPQQNRAKSIILVGLPYWPHRPWLIATFRKVWREGSTYRKQHRLTEWGRKWLYHIRYAFGLYSVLRMGLNRSLSKPWNSTHPQLIVRNQYDEYCCPTVFEAAFKGPRTFISLPGEHDDCWDNPEPYVNLLQSVG